MKEFFLGALVMVVVVSGVLLLNAWAAEKNCYNKWVDSGMESKWAWFTGCRVKQLDGTWMPAEAFRKVKQ